MPRESSFGKLIRHFHEHPQGRLHEILFWAGIGIIMGAATFLAWRTGNLATPLALMLAIVSACLVGWAFLPQRKVVRPPPPKGKRGEIQQKVKASKAERKKKDDGLPPPPIRRG